MLYYILLSAPRPECTSDYECPTHLACIREKCQDPCQSHTCGINAECMVRNHRALCVCLDGFVGDPFTICEERKMHTHFKISCFLISHLWIVFLFPMFHFVTSIQIISYFSGLQKRFGMSSDTSLHQQGMSEPLFV